MENGGGHTKPKREITNIYEADFKPYDMDGPVQDDMSLLEVTYDRYGDKRGVYVIRMEPGAETIPHTHKCNEDYLILEGDLIEPDGRVLGPGDFVHQDPGTHHNSRTETGCLLIGFDWSGGERG